MTKNDTLSATKKTKAATKAAAKPKRRLQAPTYSSFRLQKRITPMRINLPSGYRLFKQALRLLADHWRVFLGIIALYGFLNALFVQSFSGGSEIAGTKSLLDQAFGGGLQEVISSASIFVYLLGSSGNTNSEMAGAYQMILTLVVSLALIWTLREAYAKHVVRVRDGFYKGMYPLVPFLLVLLVVLLQLFPLLLGLFLYNLATTQGIAVTGIEQVLWMIFLFLMALASFYMVSSSLFALYIVCLPDMTPLKALRSARQLVHFRRWAVLRKILFLPFCMLAVSALIMIPIIIFVTPLAPWVFFVLSMVILPLIHSYMYSLYRELL